MRFILAEDININRKSNIYITGVMGAGKSTYADKLAKETGKEVWNIDKFHPFQDPKEQKYTDWIRIYYPELLDKYNNGIDYTDEEHSELVEKFVKWTAIQSDLIIEGIQLLDLDDLIDLDQHRFILLDVPFDQTSERANKRDGSKLSLDDYEIFKDDLVRLRNNNRIEIR